MTSNFNILILICPTIIVPLFVVGGVTYLIVRILGWLIGKQNYKGYAREAAWFIVGIYMIAMGLRCLPLFLKFVCSASGGAIFGMIIVGWIFSPPGWIWFGLYIIQENVISNEETPFRKKRYFFETFLPKG